ncbi:MAG: STAS domain-containing protein [Nitrospinota bacterium]
MECKVKRKGDVAIMALVGSIGTKESLVTFKQNIERVVGLGIKQIILNLEKFEYIDSSGLGRWIMLEQELAEKGGTLKAVHVSENILSVLKITRLDEIIKIYPDEQSALQDT